MKKYRKGVAFGTWDCFHFGHIDLLRKAKEQCDYLIVGVDSDNYALKKKGKVVFQNYNERADNVKSLCFIDEVLPQILKYQKRELLIDVNPDVVFVGTDHLGEWEGKRIADELGIEVVYLNESIIHSKEIKEIISEKLKKK